MSSQITTPNTEAAILARLIQAEQSEPSHAVAEYPLSISFSEGDTARMNLLSELAREGKLTTGEQLELDSYIHVTNLVSTLQSKARRALRRASE